MPIAVNSIAIRSADKPTKEGESFTDYVVSFRDNCGPQEKRVSWEIGRLLFAAMEAGRREVKAKLRELTEF